MYPAIEISLRLGHVGAAHQPVLAAFGYAFRPSTQGTNLLPSKLDRGRRRKHTGDASGDVVLCPSVGR
jgi:hypothetical protein